VSVPASKDAKSNGREVGTSTVAKDRPSTALHSKEPPRGGESASQGLIGARLRARRLARGISLRQFARDLDVSASFISQLETGKAQPSVATLFAICSALDIVTDDLFDNSLNEGAKRSADTSSQSTDAANNSWHAVSSFGNAVATNVPTDVQVTRSSTPVVHPGERNILVLDSGVTWESLTAVHHEKTQFMFVRYDVGGSSTMEGRLIRHVGTEYGFILRGTLEVTLGFEQYRLDAGDSISFDSTRPHRLTNVGDVPVEAIWFNLERFDSSN
jgi:transcriptional regulator with XRE-family HTH domain/quercetin dioxygenase-like cupin family protein